MQKVMMIPHAPLLNQWAQSTNMPDERLAYLFEYCANGCVAFLRKWVLSDAQIPPHDAARMLHEFINDNLASAMPMPKRN